MLTLLLLVLVLLFAISLLSRFIQTKKYRKSSYHRATGVSFLEAHNNKGRYGEYQICQTLDTCAGYKRLLVNIYLPLENGKHTEIDVVMLNETGIFVIESKNYGGWIFGDENSRMWTQVFNNHCKHEFLNPIRQNMGHLKATQKVLAKLRINNNMFHSYIVFGKRCNLDNIQYNPLKASVINLAQLPYYIELARLSPKGVLIQKDIDKAYKLLACYANPDDSIKAEHISATRRKYC